MQKNQKSQRNAEHCFPPKQPQCWSEQLELVWLQTQLSPPGPWWRGNPATIGQSWKQRTKWAGIFVEMNCLNSTAKLNHMKRPGHQQQTGLHPCCCVCVPLLSILFHSGVILPCSGIFRFIPVYSVQFHSIPFHSIPVFSNALSSKPPVQTLRSKLWRFERRFSHTVLSLDFLLLS